MIWDFGPSGPNVISGAWLIRVPYKEECSGGAAVLFWTILGCYSGRGRTDDFLREVCTIPELFHVSEKCVRVLKMAATSLAVSYQRLPSVLVYQDLPPVVNSAHYVFLFHFPITLYVPRFSKLSFALQLFL